MKIYAEELRFLREHWDERSDFPWMSREQLDELGAEAAGWARWTAAHQTWHNALNALVLLAIVALDVVALALVPAWLPRGAALAVGTLLHGFVIYTWSTFTVHEGNAHRRIFLGGNRVLEWIQSHACQLILSDPTHYPPQHATHHQHLGTEKDETLSNYVWPVRILKSFLPGAAYLPFNDYTVDPGTATATRGQTNAVGGLFHLGLFFAVVWAQGWLYALVVVFFVGPWASFVLDRIRESVEHQLMPADRKQGARNLGTSPLSLLVGGGPWGQVCHLSHHMFPSLAWYAQIGLNQAMKRVLAPAQRRAFLVEGLLGLPRLVWRIARVSLDFYRRERLRARHDLGLVDSMVTEAMLVSEHPDEPLAVWLNHSLQPGFPEELLAPERLRAATRELLRAYPRLGLGWKLSDSGHAAPVEASGSDELVEGVWRRQSLSFDAFLRTPLPADRPPAFVLRATREDGFSIKAHHAVLDGRGVMELLNRFMVTVVTGEAPPAEAPPRARPSRLARAALVPVGLIVGIRRLLRNKRDPSFLFARTTDYVAGRIHYVTRPVELPWFEAQLQAARARHGRLSSTELVLAAYHLALGRRAGSGARRISTMMTVDGFAGPKAARPLGNLALGSSISSDLDARAGAGRLVDAIRAQCVRAWTPVLPGRSEVRWVANVAEVAALRATGYFKRARAYKLASGMPLRMRDGSDRFGRQADTALFSSLGRTPLPPPLEPLVARASGHAPFLAPMGVALTYGVAAHMTLNLSASETCLDEAGTHALMDAIVSAIEELAHAGH